MDRSGAGAGRHALSAPAALSVTGLAKRYGAATALAGLDLEVAPGEIVGLLGPNGAGKTTTIEAIAGLVPPDAGTILTAGADVARAHAARRRLGVLLQATGLPDRITPAEALSLFARLHGRAPDPAPLLARVGLAEQADAAWATLSGGQRQRLAFALAFVGEPALLLLDEPTAGLDPAIRRGLQDEIRAFRDAGGAVLLATHDMAEAERLCDRLVILDRGHAVAVGTPAGLIAGTSRGSRLSVTTARAPAQGWPARLAGARLVAARPGGALLIADDLAAALAALTALLLAEGIALEAVEAGAATLEDVVRALTGPIAG